MSFEGGRRFEDPDTTLRETLNVGSDSRPDTSQLESASWLSDFGITVETIERIRGYLRYQEASTEYIIYDLIRAKLVEKSPNWTAAQKQRVRNLLGSLRLVGLPNMNEGERAEIHDHAARGFFTTATTEINPTTIADVQAVWATFGLARPTVAGLPAPLAETIDGFFPPQPAQISS